MLDRRPVTPPSRAVRRVRKQLSPKPQTPRFDPSLHRAATPPMAQNEKDDSFVAVIETRSPAKITSNETVVEDVKAVDGDDQVMSPVLPDAVVSKPSVLRSPRIEDSVEEIDRFEEAIDKIGESLPIVPDEPGSPVVQKKKTGTVRLKAKQEPKVEPKPTAKATDKTTKPKAATTIRKARTRPAVNSSHFVKPALLRAASKAAVTEPPAGRVVSNPPIVKKAATGSIRKPVTATPKPSATAPKPSTTKGLAIRPKPASPTAAKSKATPSFTIPFSTSKPTSVPAPTAAPPRPKPRVSSVSKAPFVPAKSSKPTTTSAFTLPGEAISARLKTQREERLKREEAAVQEKREFKARPVRRSSMSAAVNAKTIGSMRGTTASRARMSMVKPAAEHEAKGNVHAAKSTETTTNAFMDLAMKESASSAASPSPRTANMKAVRSPPSSTVGTTKKAPGALPKVRAKAPAAKTELQIRREQEEAAKKARTEAAERGRAASRLWAEKMKHRGGQRARSGTGPAVGPRAEDKQAVGDVKEQHDKEASPETYTTETHVEAVAEASA